MLLGGEGEKKRTTKAYLIRIAVGEYDHHTSGAGAAQLDKVLLGVSDTRSNVGVSVLILHVCYKGVVELVQRPEKHGFSPSGFSRTFKSCNDRVGITSQSNFISSLCCIRKLDNTNVNAVGRNVQLAHQSKGKVFHVLVEDTGTNRGRAIQD